MFLSSTCNLEVLTRTEYNRNLDRNDLNGTRIKVCQERREELRGRENIQGSGSRIDHEIQIE